MSRELAHLEETERAASYLSRSQITFRKKKEKYRSTSLLYKLNEYSWSVGLRVVRPVCLLLTFLSLLIHFTHSPEQFARQTVENSNLNKKSPTA